MRGRALAPMIAAGAVVAVALIAAVAGPVRVGAPVLPLDQLEIVLPWGDNPPIDGDDEDAEQELPWEPGPLSVGVLMLAAVMAAVVVVVIVRLLRGMLRDLDGGAPGFGGVGEDPAIRISALREAAELAAREAETAPAGAASDTVVACWVLLEDAAADVGTPRAAPNTPTEFTVSLLTAHNAERASVMTLLRLYHQARFGSAALPDAAAESAAAALRRIASSLSVSPYAAGQGTGS